MIFINHAKNDKPIFLGEILKRVKIFTDIPIQFFFSFSLFLYQMTQIWLKNELIKSLRLKKIK